MKYINNAPLKYLLPPLRPVLAVALLLTALSACEKTKEQVTPAPVITVTTVAGGFTGYADGAGARASFYSPTGIALAADGSLYVCDAGNNRIRKVTPTGDVSTFAGNGTAGKTDGMGTQASFSHPNGIAIASDGTLYIADTWNNLVRKITAGGVVSTLAGNGNAGSTDGTGAQATFSHPNGIALASDGTLYVTDNAFDGRIRKITAGGVVTTIAGSSKGDTDGLGAQAKFFFPSCLAIAPDGTLFVADTGNGRIRKITASGVVSTLAGSTEGYREGTGTEANFYRPNGIALASDGTLYIGDTWNNRIRKITAAGVVSTLAGDGNAGRTDGIGTQAKFSNPFGIATANGTLYITDSLNDLIRQISIK